jgi:hypothetical protein
VCCAGAGSGQDTRERYLFTKPSYKPAKSAPHAPLAAHHRKKIIAHGRNPKKRRRAPIV